MKCCICSKEITEKEFNNPEGAMWLDSKGNVIKGTFFRGDVCCDECNLKYVLPGRVYALHHKNKENK